MAKSILLTTICPAETSMQLALYYLKAYFKKYSKKSVSIDIKPFPFNEDINSVISQISKFKRNIVGFSCYVWNVTKILKVARLIKENMPGTKIVLGGPEVSPRAYQLMHKHRSIDAVVIGEGEETFKELIEYWLDNKMLVTKISGLVYRQGNRLVVTDKRVQIPILDHIPSPYLEGIADMSLKSYNGEIPIETMRGCLYRCHYCYYHKEFLGIRYFTLERVEKELQYILKNEPRRVYLMDPTFNQHRKRAKEILKIFISYNRKSNLHVELKAELLDKEMINLLHRAKANFVEIGIQTTNKKALRLINRDFKPYLFRKNILRLNNKRIFYEIQLIDSLPADNYRSLKKSIDWLFVFKPALITIMRLRLLPGTYLRQHARDFKIRYNPRPPYLSTQSNSFSPQDLKRTQDLALAMSILYDRGLLRKSLYILIKKLGLSFSGIFEDWNHWMRAEHNEFMRLLESRPRKNDKIKKAMPLIIISKIAELSADFVEYLCRRYNKLHVSRTLVREIHQDRQAFLNSCGIIRKNIIQRL